MMSRRMQEHLRTIGEKRWVETYQQICRWHPREEGIEDDSTRRVFGKAQDAEKTKD